MDNISTVGWEIEQLVKARLFPDQQAVIRSALRPVPGPAWHQATDDRERLHSWRHQLGQGS